MSASAASLAFSWRVSHGEGLILYLLLGGSLPLIQQFSDTHRYASRVPRWHASLPSIQRNPARMFHEFA
jgi:hypothetical protein